MKNFDDDWHLSNACGAIENFVVEYLHELGVDIGYNYCTRFIATLAPENVPEPELVFGMQVICYHIECSRQGFDSEWCIEVSAELEDGSHLDLQNGKIVGIDWFKGEKSD